MLPTIKLHGKTTSSHAAVGATIKHTMFEHVTQFTAMLQEIKTVVERAIERQQQYKQHHQKTTVAVVLDEGGLPQVGF